MTVYTTPSTTLTEQSLTALRNLTSNFEFTKASLNLNTNVYQQAFGGSWQAHHIIPKQLMELNTFVGDRLRLLTTEGIFSIRDGMKNGIWLPTDQPTANATGLTMHRGSHPAYTAEVNALLTRIFTDANIPLNE